MRADNLKMWLVATRKAEKDETTTGAETTEENEATEFTELTEPKEVANWERVVDLVQTAFREGRLAEEATRKVVVLIHKGKKYYRVIGLVGVMWKVVVAI